MGQSFYTSIGGIKAAQNQINVVSDNLANLNTVGFKESNITFSDVYYNTMSSGSQGTSGRGGSNPKQIGLGTQVSSIGRNFANGATNTTGKATDMKIQGNGFFTVLSPNNETLYTRAGNFSLDAAGNLGLPNGCRLLGTANAFGTQAGSIPIQIPPKITTVTTANTIDIGTKALSTLNNASISTGNFTVNVRQSTAGVVTNTPHVINISSTDTLQDIVDNLNAVLSPASGTATLSNGKLTINPADPQHTMTFTSGTSNFVGVTEINSSAAAGPYSTKVLDYKQTITPAVSMDTAVKYSGMDIYENGTIEAKYSNGDKLTVTPDANNQLVFKYTTADGVVIQGNDVTVDPQVATPANFQMQVANFINPDGLVAQGGNTYAKGVNTGDAFYGTPGSSGFGSMQSGALEASNVDMTKQFADMIIAQRSIEANSRVFDSQNQIMKTLVYIGQ